MRTKLTTDDWRGIFRELMRAGKDLIGKDEWRYLSDQEQSRLDELQRLGALAEQRINQKRKRLEL